MTTFYKTQFGATDGLACYDKHGKCYCAECFYQGEEGPFACSGHPDMQGEEVTLINKEWVPTRIAKLAKAFQEMANVANEKDAFTLAKWMYKEVPFSGVKNIRGFVWIEEWDNDVDWSHGSINGVDVCDIFKSCK